MGPIEFAVFISLLGFIYLRYKDSTLEYSLRRRDKIVPKVREIIENPNYSSELKTISLGVFHVSAYRNFLPALIWHVISNAIKYSLLGFIYKKETRKDLEVISKLPKSERKKYIDLIVKHMLPINVINAPHWYMLLAFFLLIYLLLFSFYKLGRTGKAHINTMLETAIISKICNTH